MGALLQIDQVTKHYDGVVALQDVSLTLAEGEILGLFGPNGAGKTTLFNVVTGATRPDSGSVALAGTSTDGLPIHHVARMGLTRAFQELRLIRRATVLENLLLYWPSHPGEDLVSLFLRPRRCSRVEAAARERGMEVLRTIALADRADDLAEDLSYGQQKLLSVGCCLVANARVVLLDEPVAGVAPRMADSILKIIRGLAESNKGVILIEHSVEALVAVSHRLAFMDTGRIVCEGPPEDVLTHGAVIAAYLE